MKWGVMRDASSVHTSSVDKEITLTYDEWEKQVPAAITNDTTSML